MGFTNGNTEKGTSYYVVQGPIFSRESFAPSYKVIIYTPLVCMLYVRPDPPSLPSPCDS